MKLQCHHFMTVTCCFITNFVSSMSSVAILLHASSFRFYVSCSCSREGLLFPPCSLLFCALSLIYAWLLVPRQVKVCLWICNRSHWFFGENIVAWSGCLHYTVCPSMCCTISIVYWNIFSSWWEIAIRFYSTFSLHREHHWLLRHERDQPG